jgi:hypothetical protein
MFDGIPKFLDRFIPHQSGNIKSRLLGERLNLYSSEDDAAVGVGLEAN